MSSACAEVTPQGGATGGATTATGGTSFASGGTSSATGGSLVSTSGGTSSGGTSSGGTSTGGSSLGGASTGGTSSGGTFGDPDFDGQCAGIPTYDEWTAPDQDEEDPQVLAVIQCEIAQSECSSLEAGEYYLFECVSTDHYENCATQRPSGGSSWSFVGECTEGMGGSSGM